MHLYEGILAATSQGQQVLVAGGAMAALGTAIGLRRLDYEHIPRTAVMTAAFFVVTLIQFPLLGVTSEHLVLGGLMGLVLGWAAFPAVLVALGLQTLLLPCGGPLVLGVNTCIMALPAVICRGLFHRAACSSSERVVFFAGFAAGAAAILLGGLINAACLVYAGKSFAILGPIVFTAHLPVALVEGFVTGSVVALVRKVRPELLDAAPLIPSAIQEAAL